MVKPTDLYKLHQVREAAIRVIVERGYFGATIAQISKEAGVSDGYLYRHYPGKAELVKDLFIERMGYFHTVILEAIRKESTVKAILFDTFQFLIDAVNEEADSIAFIFMMDHDHNFEFPDEVRKGFRAIGEALADTGRRTSEISIERSVEEILTIVFGIPIKFIEMRRKSVVIDDPVTEKDIGNLVNICLNALK